MRAAILLTWALIFGKAGFCQHNVIDSLQTVLKNIKSDTGKAIILYQLSDEYQVYKPDSALLLAQQAYDLSEKNHFLKGESWALNQIGGAFSRMGNSAQALDYYLRQLKIEEERNKPYNLATINMNIAAVYISERDTAKAIFYILKSDSVIRQNKLDDLQLYILLNKGDIFEKAGRLNEALDATQQCYQLAKKNKDSLMIGSALNNLGNIYSKTGDAVAAISNYNESVPYLFAMNDLQSISEGKLGVAKAYATKGITDSALLYALYAYNLSYKNAFQKNALASSQLISQLYKKNNLVDSAFHYQSIMVGLKDSLESVEKVKMLEGISIEEQLRQQHLLALANEEREENRQRLQLLAIGILIPVCFLASMYLSRKKVHKKVIEFSGVLSLLLLFEYITLFIHPFVAEITHHSPFLEMVILVGIAALVVPAHHKIESWFVKRLASIHEKHMYVPAVKTNEAVEKLIAEDDAAADVYADGEHKEGGNILVKTGLPPSGE